MNTTQWKKAKHMKKEKVRCPRCRPFYATFDNEQKGILSHPLVDTHELDDCFIHVCINHNIVWREVKE